MSNQPLVSVIVPVYNVEKYLERCVQSIREQSYRALEIILVDDGSRDACPALCDAHMEADDRVVVIHQENQGLSAARNAGLDKARGEYVVFIDSDDYVTPFHVENLREAMEREHSDLAMCKFANVVDGEEWRRDAGTRELLHYRTTDDEGCLSDLLYQRGIDTSVSAKMFPRSLIGDMRFPVGKLYEDIMFTVPMISRAKKVAMIDNVDFLYYHRRDSIQYQPFDRRKMDCIWQSRQMLDFVAEKYPRLQNAARVRYFGAVCNILFQIPQGATEFAQERTLLWNEVRKYRKAVLADKGARKKSKAAALLSFFGLGLMKRVYHSTQARGKAKE